MEFKEKPKQDEKKRTDAGEPTKQKIRKTRAFEGFHYDDIRKSKLKRIKTFMTWDELYSVEHAFFTLERFRKTDVDGREDIQKDIRRVWRRLCREMDRKLLKSAKQVEIELSENDMDLIEDLFFCEVGDRAREVNFEKMRRIYMELCRAGRRKREIVDMGYNEQLRANLHALLEKEKNAYCINVLEVPGVISQGDTRGKAIDMVKEALELVLEEITER